MDTNFSKEVISLNSNLKPTKRNTPLNCRNDGLMDLTNIYATKEYIDNLINTIPDIQGEKENNIVEVKNYTIIDNDEKLI